MLEEVDIEEADRLRVCKLLGEVASVGEGFDVVHEQKVWGGIGDLWPALAVNRQGVEHRRPTDKWCVKGLKGTLVLWCRQDNSRPPDRIRPPGSPQRRAGATRSG
jgi:hypothetical protein